MKAKNDLSLTYMGHLQQAWYASDTADVQDINQLLNGFKQLNSPQYQSLPIFFVIDYTAQQYLVMTNALQNIAGYHPRDFLETKLEKLMEVFHKDDFAIFNQRIFTANAAFLKNSPQQEHHQHVFSYNFRFRHKGKKMISVIQRGQYITSKETGLPLYSFGSITDITDMKTNTVMLHTIERVDPVNYNRNIVLSNYFYPNLEESLLTRREKLILNYLCDGLSSKQLADKLFISENTVVNHKQNMMRKTNTKTTVELVAFSFRNGLV